MSRPGDLPGENLAAEFWTHLGIAIFVVFLRCFARIQVAGIRKLRLDDWGMQVAVVFQALFHAPLALLNILRQTLFALLVSSSRLIAATTHIDASINPSNMPVALTPALANNNMTNEYRANLDPVSVEYQLRVAGSKHHLLAWSLYVSILWCLKLCVAIFYTRLTDGLSHIRMRILIAYTAIGVTYIVVMATLLGACRPFPRHWQINPNPGNHCMPGVATINCCVVLVLNALTDLYLLHIPVLLLYNAQLPPLKKFFLIFLFSGGLFITVGGIVRIYFILIGGRRGGREAALWGMRELLAAFVITNLPIIYGEVRIWITRIRLSRRSRGSGKE